MEKLSSGIPLPFEVTYPEGLDVAMKIYDMSTGTPVFVSTTAMTHLINGTYYAFFTAIDGKTYLVNKMVYTDNTFATPDSNFSAGSETFEAQAVSASSTLVYGSIEAALPFADLLEAELLD